jgi:hypothetical protein
MSKVPPIAVVDDEGFGRGGPADAAALGRGRCGDVALPGRGPPVAPGPGAGLHRARSARAGRVTGFGVQELRGKPEPNKGVPL